MEGLALGMFLAVVLSAAFVFVVFRPAYKEFVLGSYLTRLTTMVEEVEAMRARGQAPSHTELQNFERQWSKGVRVFRHYSPMRITRELIKNGLIAERLGRSARCHAITLLNQRLYEQGIAMHIQDFQREAYLAHHGL